MLYLTRKIGESIIINNTIELTVTEVRGRTVKLGFVFPPEASILRKELYLKIKEQNIAAAADVLDDDMFAGVGLNVNLDSVPDAAPEKKPDGDNE